MRKKISIVVPCYNEEDCVLLYYEEMQKVVSTLDTDFEYVFVNDGSKDKTLELIKELAKNDPNVRYVSFSRNFGKEAAIYAGLNATTGDYVGLMDVDLQDPPYLVKEMYKGIVEEGYDCVGSRRITRKGEPKVRSFFARLFYKIINRISDANIVDGARDFRLMTRPMVDAILSMNEYDRFSKGIFGFVGFNIKWLEYENVDRVAGKTKWSFKSLMKYAIDGIEDFSSVPLAINKMLSISSFLVALGLLITMITYYYLGRSIDLLLSLSFVGVLIAGFIFMGMGVQSAYIRKIYRQSKNRPVYIVKESNINK